MLLVTSRNPSIWKLFKLCVQFDGEVHPRNIILLFVDFMQQKGDLPCNCIGNLFNPQEKLFLVRKKELEEVDPPILRRGNKSSEVKNESEGKPQKKSLKKRPLSNLSNESSTPLTPTDPIKNEQLRACFDPDDPHFSFSRVDEHPFSSTAFTPHLPNTTRHGDHHHKQKSYNQFSDQRNYLPQTTPQFFPAPPRTLILQPTVRHAPSPPSQNNQYQKQPPSHPQIDGSHSHSHPHQHQHTQPNKAQLPVRQERESWMHRDESLLIEDFDRLFNQEGFAEDKPRVRQTQRSRRFQKQQLVGRFAESDDDAVSDPPSEVIGKGFQSHFHDFWEEEGNHAKETFASRSTNTKLSELQRGSDNLDLHSQQTHTHQRNKFGTSVNYKSYKFL